MNPTILIIVRLLEEEEFILIQGNINTSDMYNSNYHFPPLYRLNYMLNQKGILICLKSILIEKFSCGINSIEPSNYSAYLNQSIKSAQEKFSALINSFEKSHLTQEQLNSVFEHEKFERIGIDIHTDQFDYQNSELIANCIEFNNWLKNHISNI